jgi:hypothetical protein|tara:strand:- start:162 stop:305 length:144 start_codon:yes stop_codon:yes gene_type:complete
MVFPSAKKATFAAGLVTYLGWRFICKISFLVRQTYGENETLQSDQIP